MTVNFRNINITMNFVCYTVYRSIELNNSVRYNFRGRTGPITHETNLSAVASGQ